MMQSAEEHQEIPTEDAAVMLVREPRKWHRVRYLAVENRRKRKDRTQGNHGSRRKSTVNCFPDVGTVEATETSKGTQQ
jgi:hypothetical protein